ncbi:MAG: amidohydrolase [Dehalococcoidia bacterium]|nr:MAG: amidohydrolase [Dehalococcoidia bacterium]
MIIDCHTHVFSPELISRRDEYAAADACFAMLYGNNKAKLRTAEDLIAEMDSSGVDQAVMLNIGWTRHDLCALTNDYLLDAAAKYPGRLIPFVSIQPAAGKQAVTEIRRCAAAGAKGVGELRPNTQGFKLNDQCLTKPFIEAIIECDLILVCHADEPVGHRYSGKGSTTPEVLLPFINDYPELKLILSHWGGGLPFYTLMPEVQEALQNVWFDSAASPFLYRPEIYERVADLVGGEKILFGSDWPLLRQQRCLEELEATNLSTWTTRNILGGNAAALLGLSDDD